MNKFEKFYSEFNYSKPYIVKKGKRLEIMNKFEKFYSEFSYSKLYVVKKGKR